MMFTIRLHPPARPLQPAPDDPAKKYDDQLDNVQAELSDLCELLEGAGVEFEVTGFGQRWPVDVSTDLAVLLEQLPHAIASLTSAGSCELNFYEQGIQRLLTVTSHGDVAHVLCESGTPWEPSPPEELVSVNMLLEMLIALRQDFYRFATAVSPGTVAHPWIAKWYKGEI